MGNLDETKAGAVFEPALDRRRLRILDELVLGPIGVVGEEDPAPGSEAPLDELQNASKRSIGTWEIQKPKKTTS